MVMKTTMASVLVFLSGLAITGDCAKFLAKTHPIAGVVTILGEKETLVEQEAAVEADSYGKFVQWVSESTTSLEGAIAASKSLIEVKASQIESLEKQEEELGNAIEKLEKEVQKIDKRELSADNMRLKQKERYDAVVADLSGTIGAVSQATSLVGNATTNSSEFLQVAERATNSLGAFLDDDQQERLRTAVKQSTDPAVMGDRANYEQTYQYKAGPIVELLNQLLEKFKADKADAIQAETNALNAYDLAKQEWASAKELLEAQKGDKTVEKATAVEDLASAKTEKAAAEGDLSSDEATLADTKKQSDLKAAQWKERSKVREREISALKAAVRILEKVTNVRTEAPTTVALPTLPPPAADDSTPTPAPAADDSTPTPAPATGGTSFLQVDIEHNKSRAPASLLSRIAKHNKPHAPASLLSRIAKHNKPHAPASLFKRVASMLRTKSKQLHSKALKWLARQMTGASPFSGDMVNVIMKMIWRLEDEQKEEVEHKSWCTKELSNTKIVLYDKRDKEAAKQILLDQKKADMQLLVTQVSEIDTKIVELIHHMSDATEIRNVGKRENAKALEDAEDAQKAIANAISVIESYYKDSGALQKEAWEFMQTPITHGGFMQEQAQAQAPVELPANPDTWDSSYTGATDAANGPEGILASLNGVAEQFATMEADTKAQENSDTTTYEQLMKDTKVDIARRRMDAKMKTDQKNRLVGKISDLEISLKNVAKEVRAAQRYADDLAVACEAYVYFDNASTAMVINQTASAFEERTMARFEEINALKQAKAIITGAALNISTVTAAPVATPTLPPVGNATNDTSTFQIFQGAYGYTSPWSESSRTVLLQKDSKPFQFLPPKKHLVSRYEDGEAEIMKSDPKEDEEMKLLDLAAHADKVPAQTFADLNTPKQREPLWMSLKPLR